MTAPATAPAPYRLEPVCVSGHGKKSVYKLCLLQGDQIVAEFYGHGLYGETTDGDKKRAKALLRAANAVDGLVARVRDRMGECPCGDNTCTTCQGDAAAIAKTEARP